MFITSIKNGIHSQINEKSEQKFAFGLFKDQENEIIKLKPVQVVSVWSICRGEGHSHIRR